MSNEATGVRGVLFAKDLDRVAAFYIEALGLTRESHDQDHAVLTTHGFELIVHRIPPHIASGIHIEQPPVRRDSGSLRLDYPVASIEEARRLARELGGDIDEAPPQWASPDANFFLGFDPEGNVFGISQTKKS